MTIEVIMPQLGESVIEGTITKWLKSPGEVVKEHEPLLEINTDKVDTEIPCSANGVLLEIVIPEGMTVSAGTVLARIQQANEKPASLFEAAGSGKENQNHSPAKPAVPEASPRAHGLGFLSPVVAKMAQEHNLDLTQIQGTGLGGRITKRDVLNYLEKMPDIEGSKEPPRLDKTPQPSTAPIPVLSPAPDSPKAPILSGELLPLTPLRRAIAEHMISSKRTSPHVTTVMEADLSRVVAYREANKAAFSQDGAHLTYTAFFMAAAVAALKAYPVVNSSWSDEGIQLHKGIHIGIATSLGEEGLIVPVIKNADSLSLLGIARAINDLANRARGHKLLPEEVKNGTFTITNHGTSGSLFATPIINQPQCAILGIGVIQKRVVVIEQAGIGETIAIRPMVYLSLTFDHRIVDGSTGDHFLRAIVDSLQGWN